MFSGDGSGLFDGGGEESSPGEVVGPTEEPPGALVDGQDGFFGKELFFDSSNPQMVIQVSFHFLEG